MGNSKNAKRTDAWMFPLKVLSEQFKDRFLTKVDKTDSCWLWTGAQSARQSDKGNDRYGNYTVRFGHGSRKKKTFLVHRLSYRIFVGKIPVDLEVCHSCDNTLCVRSDHLFLGTHQENMADASAKGRLKGPLIYPDEVMRRIVVDNKSGLSVREICEKHGVSPTHAARLIRNKRRD